MSLRGLGKKFEKLRDNFVANLGRSVARQDVGVGSHDDVAKPGSHDFPMVDWDLFSSFAFMERAVVLENDHSKVLCGERLLSEKECRGLMDHAEKLGFQSVSWEYAKEYRDCERVVIKAPKLAEALWARLQLALMPSDFLGVRPYGFDNEGFWGPSKINECIRVVKYGVGGHFKPHKDGAFVLDDDNRSVFTLQIYLNNEFQGGNTIFYDESVYPPEAIPVEPDAGRFVMFNHDVTHEGEEVVSTPKGKYILRADVMFRREGKTSIAAKEALLSNPAFLRMDALYKKSIALQQAGDPKGSTEAYVAAQQIQTSQYPSIQKSVASSPTVENIGWPLGFDVTLLIFSNLTLEDVTACARVCKYWFSVASHSSLWRRLFFRRWPHIAKVESIMGLSPAILDYAKPWKQAYLQRAEVDKNFVVIFFDIGSKTTRFGITGPADVVTRPPDYFHYSHYPPDEPALDPAEIPSIVSRVRGHYWSAREGLEDYLIGNQVGQSYYQSYHPLGPYSIPSQSEIRKGGKSKLPMEDLDDTRNRDRNQDTESVLSSDGRAVIHWNAIRNICKWILSAGFGGPQTLTPHPLLFVLPSFFGYAEQKMLDFIVRNQLDARAVAFVSAPVMVLLAVGRKTGLVITSGHLFTEITPVWDGGPIFEHDASFPHAGLSLEPHIKKKEPEDLNRAVGKLFFPEDPAKNLAHIAFNAVMACDEDKREELFKCVVLAGGNTFSVEDRFRKELAALAYPSIYKPTVVVPEDRMTAVTLGAKLFCSYSGVRDLFSPEWPKKRRSHW